MSRRQVLALAAVVVGLGAAAWAFSTTLDEAGESALPPLAWFAAGFVLAIFSLHFAGRGWVALFAGAGRPAVLAGGLYVSQLAKYLPGGGALQVAGQVKLAKDDEISLGRASVTWPLFAGVSVVAALTITALLAVLDTGLPIWARIAASLGLASPVLLRRGLTAWFLERGRQRWKRVPSADLLPSQPAIWRSLAWGMPMMLGTSAAYATLLHPLAPDAAPITAAVAFATAWVVGFLAAPVPAGLGVREAVLLVVLGASVAPAALVAAALAHRLTTIVAELAMIAGNHVLRNVRGGSS